MKRIQIDFGLSAASRFDTTDAAVEEITWHAERAKRTYDRCISCDTHRVRLRLVLEE